MSEARLHTPLGGAGFKGYVSFTEVAPTGMIALRGDLANATAAKAVEAATGQGMPAARRIEGGLEGGAAWASPDELLLFVPQAEAAERTAALTEELATQHALVADVSDMRAVFTLKGAHLRDMLAKLTPADLSPEALPTGEFRRSHLGQIAAAFWFEAEETAHLICFRSVADYAFDLLKEASEPGGEVGYFSI